MIQSKIAALDMSNGGTENLSFYNNLQDIPKVN